MPAGLLTAHCVARGVWGYLRVIAGSVLFVLEATGEDRRLAAGEGQVIEPETLHHIDPGPDAVFQVEFYE